jgi:hypothetical protein
MFADLLLPGVQAQVVALATLLVEKGVITVEEWQAAVKETAETMQTQEYRDALMQEALKRQA